MTDTTAVSTVRPFTGEEYLESLRDGREIWIYGERVDDVTTHPAFRNSARSIARLYDALHDPEHQPVLTSETDTGNGGFTHNFFKVPYSAEDLLASREAIVGWQRLVYGYMGRTPDYKSSFLGTLGANAEFYEPYADNARRWYKEAQERVLYVNHAIVHPPIDRDLPPDEVADICVHVEDETDNGLIVSGAKVVATGSALTHSNFIAHYGLPLKDKRFAVVFMVPMNTPGVKLLARTSYEFTAAHTGSPFDYPLSSRLDENDSIVIFDRALIPWENVFIYDTDKAQAFFPMSGFIPRLAFHGLTRLAVKLDFIAGLVLKAVEATGTKDFRSVQAQVGEIIAWRNVVWALTDGQIRASEPWVNGAVQPNTAYALTYRALGPVIYGRIREIIEHTVGSGLIYLNSHAVDFRSEEMRPYLDRYLRGSGGYTSVDRVKLMKLLWDAVGTEFGGRHELYERNYAGANEETRMTVLLGAQASGQADAFKGFAEQCMAEYNLDGWTVPDLINPDDVNVFAGR
ncbi:MAG: 4-hydroxyphenylacetate 3-monooxygenase [Solirubrobacteraceae bacterium]|jgi:4-hydroxyphenylacetate 3-monooxygenase|nr:4-hydroxyphenylacetate 3-monooxygenase [Solirubrobacteraceae bacterium]